jgi:hypothetical protein
MSTDCILLTSGLAGAVVDFEIEKSPKIGSIPTIWFPLQNLKIY